MTPTERLEAAADLKDAEAAHLERRADRQRSASNPWGLAELAARVAEDRAVAALLRAVAEGSTPTSYVFEAALAVAGSVGVSDD